MLIKIKQVEMQSDNDSCRKLTTHRAVSITLHYKSFMKVNGMPLRIYLLETNEHC